MGNTSDLDLLCGKCAGVHVIDTSPTIGWQCSALR